MTVKGKFTVTAGPEFTTLAPGAYDGVVKGVVDLGVHESTYKGVTSHSRLTKLIFEVPKETTDTGDVVTIETFGDKTSASDLSNFGKHLRAITGINDTNDIIEFCKNGLDNLVGKPVILNVINKETEGGSMRHRIASCERFDPRVPEQPELVGEGVVFSFETPDVGEFKKLSKYVREFILNAENAGELPSEIHKAQVELEEDGLNMSVLK